MAEPCWGGSAVNTGWNSHEEDALLHVLGEALTGCSHERERFITSFSAISGLIRCVEDPF